jgi:hypothetical protein
VLLEDGRVAAVGRPLPPPAIPGWRAFAALDIGHCADRRATGYRAPGARPAIRVPAAPAAVEAGASTEIFRLPARPGRPSILLGRFTSGTGMSLRVTWNGIPRPPIRLGAASERWQTVLLAEDRNGQTTRARNVVEVERLGGGEAFAAAYWLLQPGR